MPVCCRSGLGRGLSSLQNTQWMEMISQVLICRIYDSDTSTETTLNETERAKYNKKYGAQIWAMTKGISPEYIYNLTHRHQHGQQCGGGAMDSGSHMTETTYTKCPVHKEARLSLDDNWHQWSHPILWRMKVLCFANAQQAAGHLAPDQQSERAPSTDWLDASHDRHGSKCCGALSTSDELMQWYRMCHWAMYCTCVLVYIALSVRASIWASPKGMTKHI